MIEEIEVLLDKGDFQWFMQCILWYGLIFVNDLYGYYQIEDYYYFLLLIDWDSCLMCGFDILDKDYYVLDGLFQDFVLVVNEVLIVQGVIDLIVWFYSNLICFDCLICRYLDDEEDLIVFVILKYGIVGFDQVWWF